MPSARHADASHVSSSSALRDLIHYMWSALSNVVRVYFGDLAFLLAEDLQIILQGPLLQPSLVLILCGGTRLCSNIGLDSSDTHTHINIDFVHPDLKVFIRTEEVYLFPSILLCRTNNL